MSWTYEPDPKKRRRFVPTTMSASPHRGFSCISYATGAPIINPTFSRIKPHGFVIRPPPDLFLLPLISADGLGSAKIWNYADFLNAIRELIGCPHIAQLVSDYLTFTATSKQQMLPDGKSGLMRFCQVS